MPDKTILNLDEPMLDYVGKPIREISRLEKSGEELKGKSQFEVEAMSPILTVGEMILRILAGSIKPKTVEENGDLYVFIKKIRNVMKTAKNEWQMDLDEVKKLKGYLLRTEGTVANPIILGSILDTLDTMELELKTSPSPKKL